MKNTAIYVRVSTNRQAQTQTIQQQLERLQAHLAAEGIVLPDDHIFRDDGYSGASLSRPGLDQLRDRIRRACFQRVLVTCPDRLARRFVHQILLIEEFERVGCEIQFLDRPMSQDPHDQLLLQIETIKHRWNLPRSIIDSSSRARWLNEAAWLSTIDCRGAHDILWSDNPTVIRHCKLPRRRMESST